jgi:hypothetical protein
MLEVTVEVCINTVEMRCEESKHEVDNTMESEQQRELSRKACLETPLSPSTGQYPVGTPPPRPDTLPPPIPTSPTVSPLIPTRSLARHDTAEIKEFDDGNIDDVRGPVGGDKEDVDTGVCGIRMQEQLRTRRRSVILPKEAFDKSAKKFVEKPAAPPPKEKIAIRMNIEAYGKYDPVLEGRLTNTFLEKMTRNEFIQPYASVSTADIGVLANKLDVKQGDNLLFVADRFSAQPGKLDGSRRMTLRPRRFVRKLHLSGTGPLYKYLRYEIPTTVGALADRFSSWKLDASRRMTLRTRRFMRELHLSGTGPLYKYLRYKRFSSWKQIYQVQPGKVDGKLSTPPPPTTSTRPPPPHAATSPTNGYSRLGFEDIDELDSVDDDVRVQVDDREAILDQVDDRRIDRHLVDDGEADLVQDDGVGAVQDKVGGDDDDEGTRGVEEVPRIRSDTLRRPNVSYSTEEYDLSFVKTRRRRQLRKIS